MLIHLTEGNFSGSYYVIRYLLIGELLSAFE